MYPALNQTGAGHVAYGVSTMDVENANSSGDRTCSAFSQFRRPIFRPNAQRQKHPGSVQKRAISVTCGIAPSTARRTVVIELFTTVLRAKIRGCKLLKWCALPAFVPEMPRTWARHGPVRKLDSRVNLCARSKSWCAPPAYAQRATAR
jgi:hypothetical protein